MRWRGLLVFSALVGLALDARGSSADRPAPDPELPAVSAALPAAPEEVLELLPPGIRLQPVGAAPKTFRADPSTAAPLVEQLEIPSHDGSPASRLDVEYTVDPVLEARVRGVLAERGVELGNVILMDPGSGEIFAYVSTDPAAFPATRAYPTASLMKVVTAAAMLHTAPEAARRDCRWVGSPYELRRSYLKPPTHGGHVDPFWRSLAVSNNQCFAQLAVHDVGEDLLVAEMGRVGLLEPPAPQHAEGVVAPIGDELALGYLGSGLAGSSITPLGAARLAAVLAEGELVQPFWIGRVRDENGRLLEVPGRRAPRPVWLPEVTDRLRELMVGVTEKGTARSAFLDSRGEHLLGSIRVAGKTGSLSGTNPKGSYRWFIGVAPAEAPRVAVVAVVVNEPSRSGSASAVAAACLREVFCDAGVCEAARVEALHARASIRDAEYRAAAVAVITEAAHRIEAEKREVEALARVYDLAELDAVPRVLSDTVLDFPDHLLRRRLRGKIVLSVELGLEGEVLDAHVDSSTLSQFDDFVLEEVATWKFTPPIRDGHPVKARTQVPLDIRIQ